MITRKSRHEINLMQAAGAIVAEVLQELKNTVKPGISTAELDEIAEKIIIKNNALPTFKGYHGFPATICASVNEQVVHGIPGKDIILHEGDIISIDVGATYKGLVGDSAVTVAVGEITSDKQKLLEVTQQALYCAIDKMLPGNCLQDVSGAIEDVAIQHGFGIVRLYGGHGIGRSMHEDPFIPNYRTGKPGPILKSGMVMALEPMFNMGKDEVHTLSDDWTVVTDDSQPSAHFEHTVLVTDNEPKILTLPKL